MMTSAGGSYEAKVRSQIEQYRTVQNIHDLPDIFHYWSNKYLRPRLNEVAGVDSITDFFAVHFQAAARRTEGAARFLSIGAGDCSVEVAVARRMIELGVADFTFECLELSPYLAERGRAAVAASNLDKIFQIVETDINRWSPAGACYAGVMANHSLHHLMELEAIFDGVRRALLPQGLFVANDIIGRNGHMRWPETLAFVNALWALLPDRYRMNRQMNRLEGEFINHDCSGEGFEGIRAQDILRLLAERFEFQSFLAGGGLTDIFVDRSFGHNFDPHDAKDCAFIDFVQSLNDLLIDSGIVKPTMMFAVMGAEPAKGKRIWNHWDPEYCIRRPAAAEGIGGR